MNEEMKEEMKYLIRDYVSEDECEVNNDGVLYGCKTCNNFEECYMDSNTRCNGEYAESINYGGYNNEEDFWGQLMD